MGKFTIKINKNSFNAIIKGIGQIADVKGSYSYSLRKKYLEKPGYELDCQSIKTDWETVGHDIKKAMEQY